MTTFETVVLYIVITLVTLLFIFSILTCLCSIGLRCRKFIDSNTSAEETSRLDSEYKAQNAVTL
jgi:uncharacterized protein HemY